MKEIAESLEKEMGELLSKINAFECKMVDTGDTHAQNYAMNSWHDLYNARKKMRHLIAHFEKVPS